MLRKEFANLLSSSPLIRLSELKGLMGDKNKGTVTELDLLKIEGFDDAKLLQEIAESSNLITIDVSDSKIPDEIIQLLKKSDIINYRCIPIQKTAKGITVVTFDPTVVVMSDQLRIILKQPVNVYLTSISAWGKLFSRVRESVDELASTVEEVTGDSQENSPDIKAEDIGDEIISYVNKIMTEAYIKKASDIHIEPYEKKFRIRLRMDGNLIEIANPPKSLMLPIISRIKIMAKMDISEKRKPQDGRIKIKIGGKPLDFRVSSLPTLFGEKVVLRLLDTSNLQLDMTKLGFEAKELQKFKDGIFKPYGMVLVTGPTGSGKTTTLYSAVAELNTPDANISTVEDPVEFNLEGINQVNVKKDIGLTFAAALKSFLRQDPDIIMVGEIRDAETGTIAVEAALTGHFVLSTLHTNDAPSTITRIINMGIEPFLVVAALNVIVAQRLCRRICEFCKEVVATPIEELVACGIAETSASKMKVFKGKGCKVCNNTGYKGRVAIYEVLTVTPSIKAIIFKSGSAEDIKRQAIREGMKTLRMSALTKVAQGLTTLEEALSVSASDH